MQPAGEGAKVIPLRPKSKSDKPLSEPASQEIPQNVVRDATTGQPVQVVPLPGAGNKAPEGGAIPPTASATNGSGGAGGGKPPAGVPPVQGSSPVQAGHASAPAAGGNKAGGKKGGGTGSQGSDSPASKQQQGGDLVDLEAERAKRSLQKGQPANDNAETQAAPKSAAGPAIETEVQKARRDTLQSTNPVERANPPAKGTPNRNLPDVRSRFTTTEDPTPEGGQVVTTAGELGEPGKVQSFRSRYQQSKVSKHTGDDAGHRIGSDFGGPQDATNLARQNWIQNQGEGTFYDLETRWKDSLHNGARVYATVSDHFRPGENRPYKRTAEWTEVKSDGTVVHGQEVFGNFSSEKSRGAEDKYGPK